MGMFSWSRRSDSNRRDTNKLNKPTVSYASCSSEASTDSGSETEVEPQEVELGFSFSGGGWLMIYMYGVAKALREREAHQNARFIGTSAGALAAMALHLDSDFDAITHIAITKYVPMARASVRGAFRMREYVHGALLAIKGVEYWAKTKTHPRTCQVVYTSLSAMTSRRKSTFESQDDLVNGLLASCTATPIAGFPFKYDGEWVADGGFTDNQPLFREDDGVRRTVTITPNAFDASADIKPSKYIPPWWSVYPPTEDDMWWLYRLGYDDGASWCTGNGFAATASGLTSSAGEEVSPVALFETVLGQASGYGVFEDIGLFFSITDRNAIFALLKWELHLRMALEVAAAALDTVMLLWTAIVACALAFLLVGGSVGTSGTLIKTIGAIYVVVCAVHVYQKAREVKQTSKWNDIESALQEMENLRRTMSGMEAPGMKALRDFQYVLLPHHHDTLIENSLIYQISALL